MQQPACRPPPAGRTVLPPRARPPAPHGPPRPPARHRRVEKHPPGEKALADFENVLSYQEQPRTRRVGSATKSGAGSGAAVSPSINNAAASVGPASHGRRPSAAHSAERPRSGKRVSPGPADAADRAGRDTKAARCVRGLLGEGVSPTLPVRRGNCKGAGACLPRLMRLCLHEPSWLSHTPRCGATSRARCATQAGGWRARALYRSPPCSGGARCRDDARASSPARQPGAAQLWPARRHARHRRQDARLRAAALQVGVGSLPHWHSWAGRSCWVLA